MAETQFKQHPGSKGGHLCAIRFLHVRTLTKPQEAAGLAPLCSKRKKLGHKGESSCARPPATKRPHSPHVCLRPLSLPVPLPPLPGTFTYPKATAAFRWPWGAAQEVSAAVEMRWDGLQQVTQASPGDLCGLNLASRKSLSISSGLMHRHTPP